MRFSTRSLGENTTFAFRKMLVLRYIISFILKILSGTEVNPTNLTLHQCALFLLLSLSIIYLSQVHCLRKSGRVYPLIRIFYLSINKASTEPGFVQKSSVYVTLVRHFFTFCGWEALRWSNSSGNETWAARCHGSSGAPARPQRRSPPGMASSVSWPGPPWGKGPLCSSFSSWRRSCVWAQRRFSESVSATAVYARNLRVRSIFMFCLSHDYHFSQGAIWYPKHVLRVNPKSFFLSFLRLTSYF